MQTQFLMILIGLLLLVQQPEWLTKAREKDVAHERFVCTVEARALVQGYFRELPVSPSGDLCHNNCPVAISKPAVSYPLLARTAHVQGEVLVHVLVDAHGRTLYARVLTGNPLFIVEARRVACGTHFNEHELPIRQGIVPLRFVLRD